MAKANSAVQIITKRALEAARFEIHLMLLGTSPEAHEKGEKLAAMFFDGENQTVASDIINRYVQFIGQWSTKWGAPETRYSHEGDGHSYFYFPKTAQILSIPTLATGGLDSTDPDDFHDLVTLYGDSRSEPPDLATLTTILEKLRPSGTDPVFETLSARLLESAKRLPADAD